MSKDQPSDWRNTSIRPGQRISLGNVDVPKTEESEEEPSSGRLNAKVELQRLEVKPEHRRSPLPSPSELPESMVEGVIPIGWPPPRLNLKDEGATPSGVGRGLADNFNDPRRPIEPWEAPLQLIEQARRRESSVGQQAESEAQTRQSSASPYARTEPVERVPNHSFTPPPPLPGNEPRPSAALPTMGTSTLAIDNPDEPRRPKTGGDSKKGPIYLVGALALCGLTVGGALMWPSKKPVALASASPTARSAATPSAAPTVAEEPPSPSASAAPRQLPGQVSASPSPAPVVAETPSEDPSPDESASASPAPITASPSPVASKTPTPVAESPKTFSVKVQIESKAKDHQVFVLGKSNPKLRLQKDAKGSISFENLPKGTYRLKVLAKGYLDYEKPFTLPADQKLAAQLEKIPPPQPAAEPRRPDPAPDRPAYSEPPPRYTPPAYVPPPPRYDPPPPRYNPAPPQRHELPSNM